MALPQAKIQEKPDLACVGTISDIKDVKTPGEGKEYHTIQVVIEAGAGGQNTNHVVCFQPRWFDSKFDADALEAMAETDKAAGREYGPYWMYCRTVAHEKGNATLQTLSKCVGVNEPEDEDGFAKLSERFEEVEGTMDGTVVQSILRDFLLGKEVGYVLQQATEKTEDGKKRLTDKYQVGYFFVPSPDGLEYIAKSAESKRRKRPLVITWNEN